MLDTYFKRYFWTFHLAALFAGAFLVARTVNAFVGSALTTTPEKIAETAPRRAVATQAREEGVSLAAFLERNIFKAAREDIAAAAAAAAAAEAAFDDPNEDGGGEIDTKNCEPSSLAANLLATIVASDPSASMAVFQDTGASTTVAYRVGEKVLDQGEVVSIEWRNVKVRRNGRCELFSLEEQKATVAATAPPPLTADGADDMSGAFGKDVKKVSESEYEIPRAEIDNVLSNLNQVATQARIVPSFQNGKANGFKLFSIRPNSLYSKIGIQNGDIVQKINGYEMNSPDKALEIYSKLKDAQSITVDLVRRGKSQTLSYNIR